MDERFEKELRGFLGAEYPEDGNEDAIKERLEAIAPSYWSMTSELNIPPGRARQAASLLKAFQYGYDPVYGYNPEAAGLRRG